MISLDYRLIYKYHGDMDSNDSLAFLQEQNRKMNITNLSGSVCSLCGKPLSCIGNKDIIIEYISGSNYFFDNEQCLVIFKRFNHFYGNNFNKMI